ncbi:MAG: hypothetical protein AB7T38_16975 [Nitrospirales bacterium]
MLSHFNLNHSYEAWINSQEAMLRRLINKNCTVIQYRYFLMFLLLANRRYGKAKEECKRILNIYPNNLMAKTVMIKLQTGTCDHVRRKRRRRNQSHFRVGKCTRCFWHRE